MEARRGIIRNNLSGQVEEAIRRDIVAGALVPSQRLRAQEISDRYGVSATPAREALQRLAGQGFIHLDDRQSARVAEVSPRDLKEVYWLRRLLEPVALRLSFENGGDRWRVELEAATEALRHADRPQPGTSQAASATWPEVHRNFHLKLFADADAPHLLRMLTSLYHHSERYRMLARKHTVSTDNFHEHEAIVRAVMNGDIETAGSALASHIDATYELLRSAVFSDVGEAPARAPGLDRFHDAVAAPGDSE